MSQMGSRKANIRKLNKILCLALVICVVLMYGASLTTVIAKYIDKDISREAVVANTFYFSSDYLDVADADGPPSYNVNGWDGKTTKSFAFMIRNYENPLLFNDSAQDVTYTISYDNTYSDKVKVTLYKHQPGAAGADSDGYIVIPSGTDMVLKGGASEFTHDDYKIKIESLDSDVAIEHDVPVLITAKTKNTQYIKTISTQIVLKYTEYSSFIASKGIENYSKTLHALDYIVCTANEQDTSEMINAYSLLATKLLCVEFDHKYLTLDKFDDRKISDSKIKIVRTVEQGSGAVTVKITDIHGVVTTLTGDNAENFVIDKLKKYVTDYMNIEIEYADGQEDKHYIMFAALPFSQFKFTMHKKLGVKDEIWEDISSVDDMISVRIIGTSSNQ